MIFSHTGDAFWTDLFGIYRWDQMMTGKNGVYGVIAQFPMTHALRFVQCDRTCFTAVVDDFGNLVRVQ